MKMRKYSWDPVKRFHQYSKKNPNNDCIEWNGEIIWNGYGRFNVKGKRMLAHRFSYELYKGKINNEIRRCAERTAKR